MTGFKKIIKKRIRIFLLLFFILITLIILSITLILVQTQKDTRSRAASGTCTVDSPIIVDLVEQEFLQILNDKREGMGRGKLRPSQTLTKAAQWQAEDLKQHNSFSHYDSLGRITQERFLACGISATTAGGENIAMATNAQNAFNAWQNSPRHKTTMENGSFSQTGIARVQQGNTWLWVQTFSSGNDGTSPELEGSNTPTATPTSTPSLTPTPTTVQGEEYAHSLSIWFSKASYQYGENMNIGWQLSPALQLFYVNGILVCNGTRIRTWRIEQSGGSGKYQWLIIGSYSPTSPTTCTVTLTADTGTATAVIARNNALISFGTLSPTATPTSTPSLTPTPTNVPVLTATPILISQAPSSTPTSIPTTTPPPNTTTIKFSFKLVGIGANTSLGQNPNPKRPQRSLPVLISKTISTVTIAQYNPITSLFEGTLYLPNEYLKPENNITFILKSMLEHKVFLSSLLTGNTIPQFTFRSGDITSSGTIDLNDYIDMIACIKEIRCTPDKSSIDLNDDSLVDILDLNILFRSFLKN